MKKYAFTLILSVGTTADASCYDYVAQDPLLPFAADYPYPMTMQWNIVAIVEAWMLEEGIMSMPRKTSRHRLPVAYIKEAQQRLGIEESGCIDIDFVNLITGS